LNNGNSNTINQFKLQHIILLLNWVLKLCLNTIFMTI